MVEKRAAGRREDASGLVIGLADGAAARALGFEDGFGEGEFMVGVAEEDEAEDGDGIFGGFEFGLGAEFVGGSPEALFEFGGVSGRGAVGRRAFRINFTLSQGRRKRLPHTFFAGVPAVSGPFEGR
jgi:hypothetical protein